MVTYILDMWYYALEHIVWKRRLTNVLLLLLLLLLLFLQTWRSIIMVNARAARWVPLVLVDGSLLSRKNILKTLNNSSYEKQKCLTTSRCFKQLNSFV